MQKQDVVTAETGCNDDFVRATIEKLRLKLLDLTTRNPLISFKHASRTRRYIRVIDELPDQLFERLSVDSGMRFKSLGREADEPEDEKTVQFLRALAAARLEDPDYREKLSALGEDPAEKAVDRLEQELRKWLREQLGMPPRRSGSGQSLADVARRAGLDPSFDLPVTPPNGPSAVHHADSAIQTLLYEDNMQMTLARMREVVRLSIEEAGVNPLFCVFGFLEWYEDTNSETPLHAPLLLCPLTIDRKVVRGQYQYTVQSTGEETQGNVAIAERLKRDFNLLLPPYEEGDTPERYFNEVQRVIESQKGWRVRRWITTGLFSFARIAMYHDLAPDRWNSEGGLEKHPGLSRLIAGGDGGNGELFHQEEDDANTADGELEVPLIADADSSQLAALKDVLSGRNLVIEGPPGTGKSQTITNIIAAALAQGKTVLFLAEKMAALNVVRDRLVDAGLGDFCLPLHSTKAGRKETASALAKRLNRPSRRGSSADLQAALNRLNTLRDGLGRCVEAFAQPAGKLGIPVQELLWRCHAVRQQSGELPTEVDELSLAGADELTEIDIGRIVGAIERFEAARLRVVTSYGSVTAHPWHGVADPDINPIRAEDIVRRVRKLAEEAANADEVLRRLTVLTGVQLDLLKHLSQVAAVLLIDSSTPHVDDDLVAEMAQPQTLAAMEQFADELGEYAALRSSLCTIFDSTAAADSCSANELRAVTDGFPEAGPNGVKAADVSALAESRRQLAAAWRAMCDCMDLIANRAGWEAARTPAAEQLLAASVDVAALANPEIVRLRTAAVVTAGCEATLRHAIERAAMLKQRRSGLESRFELATAGDPGTLRQHARAIRSAPALPWLSRRWWRAKRAFFEIAKEQSRLKRADMARLLDELATYVEEAAAYSADDTIWQCVGPAFKGIDSDLIPYLRVAEWADCVRIAIPAGQEASPHLRRILFEAPPEQIESLAAMAKDPQMERLRQVLHAGAGRSTTIDADATAAADAAARSQELCELVQRLHLQPGLSLSDCGELADELTKSRELRESLDSSETAKAVAGARFNGHSTDPTPIRASAKFVRDVDAVGLPMELRDWLLSAASVSRLASLRTVAEASNKLAASFDGAVAELTRIVRVDFRKWVGVSSPSDVRAAELRDHAHRCAADPQGFQELIDDERARREVGDVGMQPLLCLMESHRAPLKGLGRAAKRVVFQSMAREAISRNPALATFSGDRHESLRREFRELDVQLKRLRQAAIADALAQRRIDRGSDTGPRKHWSGLALVQNEASKQKGHVTVRDLMDRAGKAIQQMMPCFMMSPLSVAQFLKPGKIRFDLVVMDEASQLRPEDAVGAIGRGAQLVVVGDPKQLPPTNFFRESDTSDEEDDEASAADEPSVLDQAISIMRPARRLKWHYRSRHASLIAFSNKEFYDSQLVVFPSPYDNHPDFGVQYVYVPDGLLRNRVNVPEAQAVAKAAIEYAARHPDRSLGIVTLNQPQAELLLLEIDRLATENEEFEAWRQQREQSLEPFFVKNLENVQGDERDTIFISTVYGPDEPGKHQFSQRFGPINNQGGHRRLNVLFTRAKCQTLVFSTMDPADLRTDETSSWGLRALKGYLKFAKDGVLDIPRETGREPDSDFEVAVMETLRTDGFDVVPQVGVVGYFIDLAIRHPSRPGEFVLGIECDGATYHSSKSARDRDRLRQEVLERLKWRIHRIWSLDWYRNSAREKARLLNAVAQAIAVAV